MAATEESKSTIGQFVVRQLAQMRFSALITLVSFITGCAIWFKVLYHTISEANARTIRIEQKIIDDRVNSADRFYEKLRVRDNEMREYFDGKFAPLQSAVNRLEKNSGG